MIALKAEGPVPEPAPGEVPTGEGWRSDTPYVDLAKRYLKDLRFQAVSPDHRLNDVAASLFGMNPAERAGVNDALREFRTRLNNFNLRAPHRWRDWRSARRTIIGKLDLPCRV